MLVLAYYGLYFDLLKYHCLCPNLRIGVWPVLFGHSKQPNSTGHTPILKLSHKKWYLSSAKYRSERPNYQRNQKMFIIIICISMSILYFLRILCKLLFLSVFYTFFCLRLCFYIILCIILFLFMYNIQFLCNSLFISVYIL